MGWNCAYSLKVMEGGGKCIGLELRLLVKSNGGRGVNGLGWNSAYSLKKVAKQL